MKKITRLFGLGFLSVAALGSFTSCERTAFKVGLLCLHGQTSTYDNNFIEAFEKACKVKGLSRDEYDIRTDVAEDYNKIYTAAKEWAEDGYALVCADSFGHQAGMFDVAREYKDTEFCHATGTYVTVKEYKEYNVSNFHNAFASIYEGRYLAGVVAGRKMVEDIEAGNYTPDEALIGYVGAYPYAEVISGYTSFFLGARSAFEEYDTEKGHTEEASKWSKKLKMTVAYTTSWYDFKAEKEAAERLIVTKKCKLISQHADSMGAPLACNQHNIPNVCYNISTKKTCSKTYLVASKINWQPYFEHAIDKAREKYEGKTSTFKPDYCGTMENGSVEVFDYGESVSQKAKDLVEKRKHELRGDNGYEKRYVFDTSSFTVSKSKNPYAVIQLNGSDKAVKGNLTKFSADVQDATKQKEQYIPDREVIKTDNDGKRYVAESYVSDGDDSCRSAPYFNLIIDDIEA